MGIDAIGTKTVALMVRDPKFLQYCIRNELDPAAFFPDEIDRELAQIVLRLGHDYKGVSNEMLTLEVGKRYGKADRAQREAVAERCEAVMAEKYTDLDYIAKSTESEITLRAYQAGIQQAVGMLGARDAEGLVKLFRTLETKTKRTNVKPILAKEGIELLRKQFKDEKAGKFQGIPTGIASIDDNLRWHGLGFKELTLIIAPPKRGKTMFMIWLAYVAAALGYKVLYVSLEVGAPIIWQRLSQCYLKAHQDDLINDPDPYLNRFLNWLDTPVNQGQKIGQPKHEPVVVDLPAKTVTARDLDGVVEDEIAEGRKPDITFVDYTRILKPMNSRLAGWEAIGESTEYMRGSAKRYGMAMVTAAQGKASSVKKHKLDHDDIGYDFSQIATADTMFGLGKRPEDIPQDASGRDLPVEMEINCPPCRNNKPFMTKIMTSYHQGRFYTG